MSIALTVTVAAAGPSVVEPPLPGSTGQPPWSFTANLPPHLAVALSAAALLTGAAGLGLTMLAGARGWLPRPRVLLLAGIAVAVLLAFLPPFGSADHLSYAAYGRMAATGHDPYAAGPDMLARLGDPVARAVQRWGDWQATPSVYGPLATAGQALASVIGGTSVRLTVFVLSLLNAAAFAGAALVLHLLARGDRARQLRAAVLWTLNPLLLYELVAGAHVDAQLAFFAVASVASAAVVNFSQRNGSRAEVFARPVARCAVAGALAGAAFSVKLTGILVLGGLAWAVVRGPGPASGVRGAGPASAVRGTSPASEVRGTSPASEVRGPGPASGDRGPGLAGGDRGPGLAGGDRGPGVAGGDAEPYPLGRRVQQLAGLAAGFIIVAGAALALAGPHALGQVLRGSSYVSISSPWRAVRTVARLAIGHAAAGTLVSVGSVVLALLLLALLLRGLAEPGLAEPAGAAGSEDPPVQRAARASLAVVLAWLFAWPYVLPWYDALGWVLLPLVAWSWVDWVLLGRTAALAVGYLPARASIRLPTDLGWLQSVVRTGFTPVALTVALVALVLACRRTTVPGAPVPGSSGSGDGSGGGSTDGSGGNRPDRRATEGTLSRWLTSRQS